jgi:hypothetical protein
MAISTKTRKNLWAKSGNRCSICKTELLSTSPGKDKLNIGEECHVISSQENGPRHKSGIKDYDSYDNLVLLCRNHHKEIDELTDTYTEELIRYIKQNHENWVTNTLDVSINAKKGLKPKFISRITSGKELFNIISNSFGYRTDYEEVETEEEADFIGGILQDLTDYGEISDMVEAADKVKMGFQLSEIIKLIEEKGYYLFAESNIEKMKFSNGDNDNWKIATLIIRRKENSQIIKFEL